jgi:hypothetical protein
MLRHVPCDRAQHFGQFPLSCPSCRSGVESRERDQSCRVPTPLYNRGTPLRQPKPSQHLDLRRFLKPQNLAVSSRRQGFGKRLLERLE